MIFQTIHLSMRICSCQDSTERFEMIIYSVCSDGNLLMLRKDTVYL